MNKDEAHDAISPGEHVRVLLERFVWSQSDLACIMGRDESTVSEIVTGKRAVTAEIARQLGSAFGTTPQYWMDIEQQFQLSKARENTDVVARRALLYRVAPVSEMVKRGWITATKDVDDLESQLLRFYGCKTVSEIEAPPKHSARKSTSYAAGLTKEQRAWLRRAIQLGKSVMAASFAPENVMHAVKEMRPIMVEPRETARIPAILASHGIRFVVVKPMSHTRIDGACIWLDDCPIIAVSLRFDRVDSFWWTLLHECGHCHAPYESLDSDINEEVCSSTLTEEREADEFARRNIIRPSAIRSFIERKSPIYSAEDIKAFAMTQNLHPAIVVGQLQRRREVPYSNFRNMLAPIRDYITPVAPTDGWGVTTPAF